MAVCPNCGASCADGTKFCSNCGGQLPAPVQQPAAQPVQPAYQQPAPQPVYQQPAPHPVYQQPVSQPAPQPVVIQPAAQPVQPVYAQPITQPVVKKEKKNGLCVAGFILSLVGLATLGITCPIGFLLCAIGLIVAIVKKQKGKGLAIAGLIISAIIIGSLTALFLSPEWDDFASEFEDLGVYTTTRSDDDDDDNSIDYVKMIEKNNWITTGDNSYMVFDKKTKSFTYYQTYLDTSDNYYTGKYQIYAGEDAFDYITEDISELGVEKSEIRSMINMNDEYEMENLLCICLDYEELIVGGEKQDRDPWTVHYFGFYLTPEEDGHTYNVLDVCNMEAASYVTFVLEEDFKKYYGSSTTPVSTTDPISTDSTTPVSTTTVVEPTYDSDTEVMGNSTTGYVFLTQGTWDYWTEADGMDDYYLSRDMRYNRNTSTIINLTVFPDQFNEGNGVDLNALVTSTVESYWAEGMTNAYYTETKMGGFDAYEIKVQYQDGMYLSVFYFYDNASRLHYVSVEYFDSDIASYQMVKDTFTMNY